MESNIIDDETIERIVTDTIDNGVIDNVHIAPIGEFVGSDSQGKPVPEKITAESLQKIADDLNSSNTEVLADIDHGAAKAGVDKDTSAAGWFTRFIVDPIKGLFASLKLTKRGKELLENREYRFISPTFTLSEDGTPVELHTASLTNMPAFKGHIQPVLNQEAQQILAKDEGIDDMAKEELIALIKEVVTSMKEEETKEETVEETVENGCSEETKNEESIEETKEETVEETKEETVENGCSEDTTNEETKEEEKKEEVIKIEALNSSPVVLKSVEEQSWHNLHGKEFFDYLAKHPEIKG